MELLTAARMRAIEQAAIGSGEVTGLELMERAGRGVVEAIFDWRPELAKTPGRAVVLCGPGNNGGDGFVVARLLKQKGWEVEVYLYGDAAKLPPDARTNHERWARLSEVRPFAAAPRDSAAADLFIDALFGTGLGRALGGEALDWAAARAIAPHAAAKTVAVDIPSGLCSDSGRTLTANDETVPAGLTVSFHAAKLGHYIASGPIKCGLTVVADIGLPHDPAASVVRLTAPPGRMTLAKHAYGHKYTHGHALILSGGVGRGGAARLAARAALRIGAGLVTVGAPPAAIIENAARLDAIMLRRITDAEALIEVLKDDRLNAVVLGPGMGVGERARDMAAVALAGGGRGVVLDADALTTFADVPEALFALTGGTRTVLTPHMGEFGRLFPDVKAKLDAPALKGPAYSKIDASREAAARAGCVILLKGPDTVIADPLGRASVVSAQYERACPWLATAGAGDVLTGMICGLLARGFDPRRAAETAAWLHQECAIAFGPGLIAEDLPEMLPQVFRELGV